MKTSVILEKLRSFMRLSQTPVSAHMLVEQISQSLRLQPVVIATQAVAAVAILLYFWSVAFKPVLFVWAAAVVAVLWYWTDFKRRFARDDARQTNVRQWISRWMVLCGASGLLWGAAGFVFQLMAHEMLDQMILVCIIIAVVFASWPAFSCWLPGLTVFTVVSLSPVLLVLAAAYGVGEAAVSLILVVVAVCVLYCGRHFNDIVARGVIREAQNARLVEKLRAEKSLAESERRATALASERRARFFAGANHDLRQPLQAMGIYLQILQARATGSDKEAVEQLSKTAQTISMLVEQLLEVSRIETGNIEVKFENIRIADLFNELSREFAPVAAAKGFLFQIRPVDAMISTDPLLLSRILRNLISNALRYSTKPGSKIVLGARRRPQGKIQIGVYDQGPGIEAADREKIFDAFYRGKSSEGMEEGFGLGLSIVRGLAQRLSIPVSVASRVGKGSVFHLNFVETESTVKAAGNGLPIASGLDIRGSIALLEDNAIVRDAVVLMMKSWGADVVASGEPDDAFMSDVIDRATNGTLSAFISDYNLGSGKPTGLEAIFTVRKASGRKIPCVLLTAVNEDEIRAAYRQLCLNPDNAGQAMSVILQKPATAESLASALRRAVAER